MRKVLMTLTLMTILISTQAMAMTPMTEEELCSTSGQFGILALGAETAAVALQALGQPGHHQARHGRAVETQIGIKDAVIDIDRIEIDLFKTAEFSMGHMSIHGVHMEIPSATISITTH